MKKWMLFPVIVPLLFGGLEISGQDFPEISESERIARLTPPEGKVRMVLDTDTYNEIDDQFAVVYALLSKEKLNVEALYAAPFSNSRSDGPGDGMEKSYEEILRLLDRLGIEPDGFVFKGSRVYLEDL
jgi:purine nucleosidase